MKHIDNLNFSNPERLEFKNKFPFSVIVLGHVEEIQMASRWCWDNVSAKDGECCKHEHSLAFPSCPNILATEHVTKSYDDDGEEWRENSYHPVESHSHVGIWDKLLISEFEYRNQYVEYYFLYENDKNEFLKVIPNIDIPYH
jgi:hypothetical protein